MAVHAETKAAFANNKTAQKFSDWLYHNDYMNKTLSQSTVSVTVHSHGDHFCIMEAVRDCGGKIVSDHVEDDY